MMPFDESTVIQAPEAQDVVPASVLLRYANLVVLVVLALAGVIALESWASYRQAEVAAQRQTALLLLALSTGALPLAMAARLAVLGWMGRARPSPGA
jgi:hypothetical protein